MIQIVMGALVRKGQILLVHRRPDRHVYPDMWGLGGGHMEPGETELDALTRELHEEIGVQIEPGSAIHLWRLQKGHGEETVHFSAWIVTQWQGTPENAAPEEHDEIRWFGPEELPPLTHEPVRKAVIEAMRGTHA